MPYPCCTVLDPSVVEPWMQEALHAAAAAGTLRTLCVLSSEAPSSTACTTDMHPDPTPSSHNLSFLSSVTSLRKLSIEGQQSVCMLLQALAPLRNLTALRLCGTEACAQATCEAGSVLSQLTALQQLNLDVVWQGSNPLAAAHACCDTCCGGGCLPADADNSGDDAFSALEEGFWAGLWGCAMELPLERGMRASLRKGCTCIAEML